jgi:hypothetical protein
MFFSWVFGYDIKEDIEADPKSKRQKYLVCEQIKKSKVRLKPIKKVVKLKKKKDIVFYHK